MRIRIGVPGGSSGPPETVRRLSARAPKQGLHRECRDNCLIRIASEKQCSNSPTLRPTTCRNPARSRWTSTLTPTSVCRQLAVCSWARSQHSQFRLLRARQQPGIRADGQGFSSGRRPSAYGWRMNLPVCSSLMAWRNSACVFITIGPYQATGSSSGWPETSKNRMPSGPAWTTISSP